MNLAFTFIIVLTCFFATARRQQDEDDDDEKASNLDTLYSTEDDHDAALSSRFISLKGELRQTFAVRAAILKQDQNMICSPLSALLPLGKLAIGAKDDALDELLAAIGVSRKRKLKSHFKPIIENLKYIRGVELAVASRLYLSKYLNLHRKFLDRSKYIFDSTAEKVDFDNPKDAAYLINTWVAKKTNGMIQDLMAPSQISSRPSLVLVNAVYFAGQWKDPFDKLKAGTFYMPDGEKEVTMMSRLGWYNYLKSDSLGAQIIEIPYAENGASFIIILPYKKNGLPALLSQLKVAPDLLNSELSMMRKYKVMLTIPKFKMETTLDLIRLYKKIGIHNIFKSKDSGLKRIVRDQSVYVSHAIQKAIIEVTELGTEAASASTILLTTLHLEIPIRLEANHPFLFYIISQRQQLFAGTLVNP